MFETLDKPHSLNTVILGVLSLLPPLFTLGWALIEMPDNLQNPLDFSVIARWLVVLVGASAGTGIALFGQKCKIRYWWAVALIPNLLLFFVAISAVTAEREVRHHFTGWCHALFARWGRTGNITDFAVQQDEKIWIVGHGVARLLPDGSPDPTFQNTADYWYDVKTPGFKENGDGQIEPSIFLLPDNSAAVLSNGAFFHIQSDGGSIQRRPTPANWEIVGFAVQPNAGFIVAVNESQPNSVSLQRLLSDGRPDPTFHSAVSLTEGTDSIRIDDEGQIFVKNVMRIRDYQSNIMIDGESHPTVLLNRDGSFHSIANSKDGEDLRRHFDRTRGGVKKFYRRDGKILVLREGKMEQWRSPRNLDPAFDVPNLYTYRSIVPTTLRDLFAPE